MSDYTGSRANLGLPTLMHRAYDAMVDEDHAITGPYCVELAKLNFQRRSSASYDDSLIQEWCFGHIRDNFILLNQDEEWLNLLPYLAGIIQTRWKISLNSRCGVPREKMHLDLRVIKQS